MVVRSIAPELSEKHRRIQHETIAMLATKLEIAINNLKSIVKRHPAGNQELDIRRWKYAPTREKIDRTIEDLKEWQSLFDPSWYLIMKLTDNKVDSGLSKYQKSSAIDFEDPIAPAQSLRRALNPRAANPPSDMNHTHSLSDRFKLANELTKAVHSIHLFGFVHKNIRPETILLLGSDKSSLGPAFLIGFDSFRMASGKTLRKGEASWERCLYQHPDRIGTVSSKDYIMQHDIYSLGSTSASNDNAPTPARASILGMDRGLYFQKHLLFLAQGELRKRIGTRYSEVVVTCLTCLDPGNVDFGTEADFEDDDGIEVGARYIEKVCRFNPSLMENRSLTHYLKGNDATK
ncbi:hypothetical protein N7445_004735 [Penicillium cf. griseofulvum]|nr:hypothetical protein N7445_004735 [Penicillium cf. griseofulvum]